MTVNANARTNRYNGDGTTDTFAVNFQFYELAVYVNGVEQTSGIDYELVGGVGNTGSVEFAIPPANGTKVVIVGDTPASQTTNIEDNDDLPADVIERVMDKAVMLAAETVERLDRTIRLPIHSVPTPELDLNAHPNAVIATDDDGEPTLVSIADLPIIAAEGQTSVFLRDTHTADDIEDGTAKILMVPAEREKLNHLTVTGAKNIDALLDSVAAARVIANLTGSPAAPAAVTYDDFKTALGLLPGVTIQAFTSGSTTYTPTAGMKYCIVFGTGGGGGGGGVDGQGSGADIASGGSAGATSIGLYSAAQIGASKTVSIGAGGTAGSTSGGNGGNGGDTTLSGGLMTATGGNGGIGNSTATTSAPPSATTAGSGGVVNLPGAPGSTGCIGTSSGFAVGGNGGGSFWGGGAPSLGPNAAGGTATVPGAGGGGANAYGNATARAGGAGAAGLMVIIEFT